MSADLSVALERLDELLGRALDRARDLLAHPPGTDPFRGLYLAHDDVARSLTRPPGAVLGVGSEGAAAPAGILGALAHAFALSQFDLDVLVLALAPEIDLRYQRLYGYLQDDVGRRRPSVDLALSLLCGSAAEKSMRRAHFAASAPLVREALVHVLGTDEPLLARELVVDDQIVHAVLGGAGIDRRCSAFATLSRPDRRFQELALEPSARVLLERATAHALADARPLRLALHGREAAGQLAAAEAVATAAATELLTVDVTALVAERDVRGALRLAFRERWLREAVLLLDGLDAVEHRFVSSALADELARDDGIVVLAGREPWWPPLSEARGPVGVVRIELRPPDVAGRLRAWRRAGVELPEADAGALAERFVLTEAQIEEGVASLPVAPPAATRAELFAAARAQSAPELDRLAAKIAPAAAWEDLVVPEEVLAQLRELAAWSACRHVVLDEWGFGRRLSRGRGATALFAGASGTGKTLAAEVVAGELGLDLYRIDLAGVVSKYIGETEKNLDRIFRAAEDANAVLFFDEADALFGKRTEVHDSHDRYANIEISYLLQKMEAYEGVTILATNLRDNLDAAFVRRLAFIVNFPFPEDEERRRIWEIVWPAELPLDDGLDFEDLAAEHRLSGGQIKNAALSAAYLAASNGGIVTREHVEGAVRREYAKSGRGMPEVVA